MNTQTQLLYEEPSSKDLFLGRGHERTAKELVRTVRQMQPRGGAVGLEGSWGVGKSTVVRMAATELRSATGELVRLSCLVFDLWSYQAEDLRQAFLKRLIDHAIRERPEHSVFFDKKRIEVDTKTVQSTKEADGTYSIPAIYFLVISPIFPLLFAWLGPAYFASGRPQYLFGADVQNWIIIIVAIGYSLWFVSFVRIVSQRLNSLKEDGFLAWLVKSLSKSLNIFSKDAGLQSAITSVIEVDPSKNRFHEIFYEIISKLRESRTDIIFVFDNIDRLSKENSMDNLASLRLIFSREEAEVRGFRPPVYIVPYDKSHLLGAADARQTVDLVEKMFERVLNVSPPVLTDWQAYLRHCFCEAFSPAPDETTLYRISRMIEVQLRGVSDELTPRWIVGLTNKTASLWRQWDGSIPILTVVLFALNKNKFDSSDDLIASIELMGGELAGLTNDGDWFKNVAALYYNVPPDHAYQVLLRPKIEESLSDPEEDLGRYEDVPGFGQILVRVVVPNCNLWAAADNARFFLAISKLLALRSGSAFQSESLSSMTAALASLKSIERMPTVSMIDNLGALLSSQPLDVRKTAATIVLNWLAGIVDESADLAVAAELWVYALSRICASSEIDLKARDAMSPVTAPQSGAGVVGLAIGCEKNAVSFSVLNVTRSTSDLASELIEHIEYGGEFAAHAMKAFRTVKDFDAELSRVGQAIGNFLRITATGGGFAPSGTLEALPQALSRSGEQAAETVAIVRALIADGSLLAQMYEKGSESSLAQIGCLWLALRCTSSLRPTIVATHPKYGNLAHQTDWYNALLEKKFDGEYLRTVAIWVEQAKHTSSFIEEAGRERTEFAEDVIREVFSRDRLNNLVVDDFVINYEIVRSIIPTSQHAKLVRTFSRWSSHLKDFKGQMEDVPLSFITDVSQSRIRKYDSFMSAIDRYISNTSSDQWGSALENLGQPLLKALARKRFAGIYLPAEPFRTCLVEDARALLIGATVRQDKEFDWVEVLNLLQPRSKVKLANEIFKTLANHKPTQSGWEQFFDCYGTLLTAMPLESIPDRTVDRVLIPLLRSQSDNATNAMNKLATVFSSTAARSGNKAKARLELVLRSARKAVEPKRKNLIRNLLRQIT